MLLVQRETLWCEQPGAWHPWAAASYSIKRPKQWLSQVGPYIILVSKALKLVVPVAAAVADMVLSPHQVEQAQDSIQLMSALVADLPDLPAADKRGALSLEEGSQLTAAQGQALCGIRALLFDQDALRAFGDLRRVQSASGDFLWICPSHYPKYDPGLPVIPGL